MPLILSLRTLLMCSALLLLGLPNAHAGDTPGAYNFRSYGPEQGLRNQAITGLAQDSDGFILVATEDGLFRYDGNRFDRFGTAEGLNSDSIIGLYQEPGGRIWIMNAKGALAWSGSKPDPAVKATILPAQRIEAIAATRAGHLFVATTAGLYEGPPGKLALVAGLPAVDTGAVWSAPDGKDVLATAQGKLYRRDRAGAWTGRALPPAFKNELIHTILKDGKGRIWIRSRRVLLRLASFDDAGEDLSAHLPGASVLKGALLPDARGGVWAPTNLGLVHFDERGPWLLGDQKGLPTQSATSMLIDREGNLWVASEGLHRLQGRLAWTAHTRRQKLPSDTVWNILRSRDGVLWAGTNRGLAWSTDTEWRVLPGTEERTIYTLVEDAEGNLWAGGNNTKKDGNALLLRPAGSAQFRSVPLEHLSKPSSINTMDFGPDKALYLGTQANGLHRMVRAGDGYKGEAVPMPKGEPGEQINQVVHDAKGRLWVAGMNGLAFQDGASWRRFGIADGLREEHVEALAFDPAGDLLVSYWNMHGLTRFKFNPKGGVRAIQIDAPATLVADNIYSLGFDRGGAMWLGTAQGIKRWKDGRLDQFARGEGLPSDDAASNAFWADANGDVWMGMASGMGHYEAAVEPPAAPLPPARVLRLQDGNGKVLAAATPQVAWEDRTLSFRFAVLSYTNESRIRTQVRLVGFEDEWRDTDIREARYTGLPPGSYRFEVRASLGSEDFGPVATRAVRILPPWWRTPWAMLLGVLGAGALLFLLLRWRTHRLRKRNNELEALVRARTEALQQANDALREASMVDPLTGLKNRRFLGLSMPDELARISRQFRAPGAERAGINHSLLFFMVDLDNFKSVNDTYGHAAGDLVLQQTSAALRAACRDADFVVRWGGEEFLIVARNSDRACADLLADKLRTAVSELHFDLGNGVILQKTCSLGFAAFPVVEAEPEAHSWEDVVKMADQCLYAAKNSGRDNWVGVILPAGADDPGPRMADQLGALVAEGRVQAISSLPAGARLRWQ
ncbi:MAG: diguanylate cyclase [Pseudomonadota bacterium]